MAEYPLVVVVEVTALEGVEVAADLQRLKTRTSQHLKRMEKLDK